MAARDSRAGPPHRAADRELNAASNVLFWQTQAQELGIDTPGEQLDRRVAIRLYARVSGDLQPSLTFTAALYRLDRTNTRSPDPNDRGTLFDRHLEVVGHAHRERRPIGGGEALGQGIAQPTFFDLYGFFPGSFAGNCLRARRLAEKGVEMMTMGVHMAEMGVSLETAGITSGIGTFGFGIMSRAPFIPSGAGVPRAG